MPIAYLGKESGRKMGEGKKRRRIRKCRKRRTRSRKKRWMRIATTTIIIIRGR